MSHSTERCYCQCPTHCKTSREDFINNLKNFLTLRIQECSLERNNSEGCCEWSYSNGEISAYVAVAKRFGIKVN